MRVALIVSGVVTNIIECDVIPQDFFGADAAMESVTAGIGDTFADGVITPIPPVYLPPIEPTPAPEPTVPAEVSNIQAFAAIQHFGLLPKVQMYMMLLSADNLTRVTWEKATVFKRTSPTLQAIATELKLTDAQLDALFIYAATVNV